MADDWTVDVDALADAALETELGSQLLRVNARQTGDAARPWVRDRMLFAARWLQETGRMYELDMQHKITADLVAAVAGPWIVSWPDVTTGPDPRAA